MAKTAAQQVDYLRSKVRGNRVFTDICTVKRKGTPTSDGEGGFSATETDTATDVPCRYRTLSVYEKLAGGAAIAGATHRIILPSDTDATAKDRIIVEARGDVPQLTFNVTGRIENAASGLLEIEAVLEV